MLADSTILLCWNCSERILFFFVVVYPKLFTESHKVANFLFEIVWPWKNLIITLLDFVQLSFCFSFYRCIGWLCGWCWCWCLIIMLFIKLVFQSHIIRWQRFSAIEYCCWLNFFSFLSMIVLNNSYIKFRARILRPKA